jgi:hypothetical protein
MEAPSKDFAAKTVPAEMNNESAVIIATSFDCEQKKQK